MKRLTICALLAATPALADAPNPGSVRIDSLNYAGSGCPQGSMSSNLSDDGKAMTLLFDDFVVSTDEVTNQSKIRKDCKVDVGITVPEGWSYGMFCVDYRGYAAVDKGLTARQNTSYSFNGRGNIPIGKMELKGPFDDDYQQLTAVPVSGIAWSRCGTGESETITINTGIGIERPQPKKFVWHKAHHDANMVKVAANVIYHRARSKVGKHAPLTKLAGALKGEAETLRKRILKTKQRGPSAPLFDGVKKKVNQLAADISANPRMAGDHATRHHRDRMVKHKNSLKGFLAVANPDALGLMTVDSVDGSLAHHYGIAWRKCDSNCTEAPKKALRGAGVISNVVRHSRYNADGRFDAQRHTNIAWDKASHQKVCEMLGYRKVVHAKRHNFSSCRDDFVAVYNASTDSWKIENGCRKPAMIKELTCAEPINPCGG